MHYMPTEHTGLSSNASDILRRYTSGLAMLSLILYSANTWSESGPINYFFFFWLVPSFLEIFISIPPFDARNLSYKKCR